MANYGTFGRKDAPRRPALWRRLLFRHFDALLRADSRAAQLDIAAAAAAASIPCERVRSEGAAEKLRHALVVQRKPLTRALYELEARHVAFSGALLALRVVVLAAIPWILLATMTQAIDGDGGGSGEHAGAALWARLALLFACHVLEKLLDVHEISASKACMLRIASALQALVFESALETTLVPDRPEKDGIADVVHMFEKDAVVAGGVIASANHAWSGAAMVSVEVYILLQVSQLSFSFVSLAFLAVAAALLALGVASAFLSRIWTTKRNALLNIVHECFKGIRMVKLNAWEQKMHERVQKAYNEADRARRLQGVVSAFLVAPFMNVAQIFSAVVIGAMASDVHSTFLPARVFTVLVLIHQMKNRVISSIRLYALFQQSSHSFKKIDALLRKHLVEQQQQQKEEELPSPTKAFVSNTVVAIENGCFKRGAGDTSLLLVGVNLTVQRGQLAVLCGKSGVGKSTLLRSMVDQMKPVNGRVFVERGCRIAYCPQEPWLQTLSIKENILFGSEYDEQKYLCVLDACCLLQDLAILPGGDSTKVGPKGVNLSGGQKARIALARACYSDADIYLLDCPLASVDAVVQSDIFRKCILDLLRRKTIIFATHNPEIIRSRYVDCIIEVADMSVVMRAAKSSGRSRRISEMKSTAPWKPRNGTITTARDDSAQCDLALWSLNAQTHARAKLCTSKTSDIGARVGGEEAMVSSAAVQDFHLRANVVPGIVLAAFTVVCGSALILAKDVWLMQWSAGAGDWEPHSILMVYIALIVGAIIFEILSAVLTSVAFYHASSRYFHEMTRVLLAAPMLFFYSTPLGEIMQRYFVDVASIDAPAAFVTHFFFRSAAVTCIHVGAIAYLLGAAGVAVGALVVFELAMLFPFRLMDRIQMTMVVNESQKLNFISEVLDGASTIRGFGLTQVDRFRRESSELHDLITRNQIFALNFNCFIVLRSSCLFGIHLLLLGCVLAAHNLPPETLALLLYYIINIEDDVMECATAIVNGLGYQAGVSRVHAYIQLESEERSSAALESTLVSAEWPTRGDVVFDQVSFRYSSAPNSPVALQNVSCVVAGGEKVGVVGRTGSGKSSVAMALFRLHPIASGRVLIDGVDASTLDLKTLRSSLSIIPEMPMFYRCSIRHYLDPFSEFTDDALWNVIHRCNLHTNVSNLEQQLWDNAENWSVGERQVLCLARALLKPSRVLILDEAFSAVDQASAKKLLAVLESSFVKSTVFMISHRLDQMLQFDKIMVMAEGKLVEFGPMVELAGDPDSALYEFLETTLLTD